MLKTNPAKGEVDGSTGCKEASECCDGLWWGKMHFSGWIWLAITTSMSWNIRSFLPGMIQDSVCWHGWYCHAHVVYTLYFCECLQLWPLKVTKDDSKVCQQHPSVVSCALHDFTSQKGSSWKAFRQRRRPLMDGRHKRGDMLITSDLVLWHVSLIENNRRLIFVTLAGF